MSACTCIYFPYIFLLRAHGPIIELARAALNARRSVHTPVLVAENEEEWGGGKKERGRQKKETKREERKKCFTERKQFKGLCLCPSRRGGHHRTHPLSPLEETDPASGPSYSLERASYEIYKHASALQIIHYWTVHACVRANVSLDTYARVRKRKESRARFGPLGSLVRGPLTYTLWPMCIPLGRGNTSSCLALEHPTSISSLIEIGRSTIIRSTEARPGPGDTSRGWMQLVARIFFFALYSRWTLTGF